MGNENGKILTLSFVVASIIIGFVVSMLLQTFSASFSVVARAMANDLVRHGIPVIVALIVFAALYFNKNVMVFGEEVVTELRKVVWPSRKDTVGMTIVVCVMLIISGMVLGLFDFLSAHFINVLVK